MKTKQMELPLVPSNPEDIYIDQAMFYGIGVFAAYTPCGIKNLIDEYTTRISFMGKTLEQIHKSIDFLEKLRLARREELSAFIGETTDALEEDIVSNEHLHPCVIHKLIDSFYAHRILNLKEDPVTLEMKIRNSILPEITIDNLVGNLRRIASEKDSA